MNLSIIIPTFDRESILQETYAAAITAIEGLNAEIIIVNDNAAAPPYLEIKERSVLINNKGKGAASARNQGASLAKGELLLFLDDDIIINKKNIDRFLEIHGQFDKILLSPVWEYTDQMLHLLNSNNFGKFRLKHDYLSLKGSNERKIGSNENLFFADHLASFCLSVKKKDYLQLNGMDEQFPFAGCEDQEFSGRAKQSGYQLILDESNIVYHNELDRLSSKTWLKRQYTGVQGFVILSEKFPDRKKIKLWYENTPISKKDSFRLKMKKIVKSILRKDISIAIVNCGVSFLEKFNANYYFLEKLYLLQTGIYINKGFTESYEKNTHHPNNS